MKKYPAVLLCLILLTLALCLLAGCQSEQHANTDPAGRVEAAFAIPAPAAGQRTEEAAVTARLNGEAADFRCTWLVLDGTVSRPMKPGEAFQPGRQYRAEVLCAVPAEIGQEDVELSVDAPEGSQWDWEVHAGELAVQLQIALRSTAAVQLTAPEAGQLPAQASLTMDGTPVDAACTWVEESSYTGTRVPEETDSFAAGCAYRLELRWDAALEPELLELTGALQGGTADVQCQDGTACITIRWEPLPAADPCTHSYRLMEQTEASCMTAGSRSYTCASCGDQTEEAIPARNMHPDYTELQRTEPTCTKPGQAQCRCNVCGLNFTVVLPARGHVDVEELEHTEATCTEDGMRITRCRECGETITTVLPARGHSEKILLSETEPTCTEEGRREYRCDLCGEELTEIIPALGHGTFVPEELVSATCTQDGYASYRCTVCGTVETDVLPATGHHVGVWHYSPSEFQHFGSCTDCSETIRESHRLEYHSAGPDHHEARCPICGMAEEQLHTFDENGVCSQCGEVRPKAEDPEE